MFVCNALHICNMSCLTKEVMFALWCLLARIDYVLSKFVMMPKKMCALGAIFFVQLPPTPTILIDLPRRTWKPCCKLIRKYIKHKKAQKLHVYLYVMKKPWVYWATITRFDPYLTWMCLDKATTHCGSTFKLLNRTHHSKVEVIHRVVFIQCLNMNFFAWSLLIIHVI